MDQQKDPIKLYISLSKQTKFLLEKLCGISPSENSKQRISWIVVLEIINDYLRKHRRPKVIAKKHKKIGSTRKIIINADVYPELHSYMKDLMKFQRTFKFDCLLYSVENYVHDIDAPIYSFEEESLAPKSAQSAIDIEAPHDIEAPVSTEKKLSNKEINTEFTHDETTSGDPDIKEFLDFMDI